MTASLGKYTDRLFVGPVPSVVSRASIVLRYTPAFAVADRAADLAETIADNMRHLAVLAECGLGGCKEFGCIAQPMQAGIVLWLSGAPLPPALIVMASRIVIGVHDADPSDYDQLLVALDGDREQTLAIWGGVDFIHAVAAVEIRCEGEGAETAFDPIWLAAGPDPLVQTDRLSFAQLAPAMPDADLEDAVLLASAFNAFWPLGTNPAYPLGDEEWFTDGQDLVVTDLSCEAASLDLLLACFEDVARREGRL